MDYFDFEEASHHLPLFDLNESPLSNIDHNEQTAQAELEAQRVQHPNPFANTRAYGTTIKLKMINDREVEGILWDHNDGTDYPMFRAKDACDLCSRMGLDCFLASRGALITGCTCCISLYRECSFTHDQMPKGFRATFPGIAEDSQVCHGPIQTATKNMRSFEDAKGRKSGSRFPRDAVKILKRWLAEHADHPYPNERQKDELKQLTGLKRSQIANWLANARRRGKVQPPSGPASPMLGAIDIPKGSVETFADLNPLDRWKASPPEHEPASLTDIARAMAVVPVSRNGSSSSLHNSRASSRKASSEDDSNWSAFRAPSASSFDTKDSTNSDFSFASSRSQQSQASKASSLERRRRRRAPMTQRAVKQANKSRSARIFQCTFCTDTFPAKYDWQRHEKSLHLALERWICCPVGGILDSPQTGGRKCAFCPQLNPTEEHLETHNYTTCQEKTKQERTFYRKDHLRQHLRLIHESKFDPAMDAWKCTMDEIKSRCGFCPSRFTTWQQRADHLAAHYRNGANMSNWHGDWGFESHIEQLVENAIPPYLIGHERSTMNPFVARSQPSMTAATPDLSTGTSPDECERSEPDLMTRDSNCWHRLEQELTKYVLDQGTLGCVPTDKQIQDHARIVIYGNPDPVDWTCAESPIWLEAFKYQMGIGPKPADENVQATSEAPLMAPYVVKGGLKNKRMTPATASSPLDADVTHTVPADMAQFAPAQSFDPDMEIDFDAVDFSSLDLDGLEDLSFHDNLGLESVNKSVDLDNQYITSQLGNDIFGSFGMPVGSNQVHSGQKNQMMSDQDLAQLSRYMAGFP